MRNITNQEAAETETRAKKKLDYEFALHPPATSAKGNICVRN